MSQVKSACKTILGTSIAKSFETEIKQGVKALVKTPLLVGFLANDDPAALSYADYTARTCTDMGFKYELRKVDKQKLEEEIVNANLDKQVDGILVYFPVFGAPQDAYIQQCVAKDKDVEGLSHLYIQNMYQNVRFLDDAQTQKSILPCTPLACVKVLEYLGVYNSILPYGNHLYGKTITVVNRSEIVGRPLAALLANDGALVYSVDLNGVQKYTRGDGLHHVKHVVTETDVDLETAAKASDVIITGVPSPNYKFPTEFVKYGSVCINFSFEKNFDPEVKTRASLYVPMIGRVTIMMLLRNLLRLARNRQLREGV